MPTSSKTGLLRVDYIDLAEIAATRAVGDGAPGLRQDPPRHREELMRLLAARACGGPLAIDVDRFGEVGFEQLRKLSDQHLGEPWALSDREQQPRVSVAYPRPGGKGSTRDAST